MSDLLNYVDWTWYAGEQLDALKFYLKGVDIIWTYQENHYQGECFAILKTGKYYLWRDSFGSCSGCDALDDSGLVEGLEYIKSTLVEGNTKEFDSIKDLIAYLESPDKDPLWNTLPLDDLKSALQGD